MSNKYFDTFLQGIYGHIVSSYKNRSRHYYMKN